MPPEASVRSRQERRGGADPDEQFAGTERLQPSEDARQASAHSTCRDARGLRIQELFPGSEQRRLQLQRPWRADDQQRLRPQRPWRGSYRQSAETTTSESRSESRADQAAVASVLAIKSIGSASPRGPYRRCTTSNGCCKNSNRILNKVHQLPKQHWPCGDTRALPISAR